MPSHSARNRRQFLCETFSATAGFSIASAFGLLSAKSASAVSHSPSDTHLVEVNDEVTGLPLLRLPPGFRYRSFGWTGDPLRDGAKTPSLHDGMAVIKAEGSKLTLVRNHEISVKSKTVPVDGQAFDDKAGGGCTTLTFDTDRGEWLEAWGSLAGTIRNCAGGVTPWGTWLSCEESILAPGDVVDDETIDLDREHGWIFEVPAVGCASPIPIKSMGRFVHEAVAVDRDTGIVYQTEDRDRSGFYRFIPRTRGALHDGGELEMLKVLGQTDLRGKISNGAKFETEWVSIEDPERAHSAPDKYDSAGVFMQGRAQDGAMFARLEGCWFGNGKVYFDATSGGGEKVGQIWEYDPTSGELTMLFESPGAEVLNMPDNLCCNPLGGLLICEDSDYGKYSQQRIHQLNDQGQLTLFAVNNVQLDGERNGIKGDFRGKEWAGASFSPDGEWLFVNIQTPGITFAITGPWQDWHV